MSTNKICNIIGSLIGILLIGLSLVVLFYVSVFYLGKEPEMTTLFALRNIIFRIVIMCLISLTTQTSIRGLARLFLQNKILKKLSSKRTFWILLTLSIILVFLFWGRYL